MVVANLSISYSYPKLIAIDKYTNKNTILMFAENQSQWFSKNLLESKRINLGWFILGNNPS